MKTYIPSYKEFWQVYDRKMGTQNTIKKEENKTLLALSPPQESGKLYDANNPKFRTMENTEYESK